MLLDSQMTELTDGFVDSLYTKYHSYGLIGLKHKQVTKNGKFQVMPTGRLVNVKYLSAVDADAYETLRSRLEDYYKGDERVNSVYICGGGTVMIDCRTPGGKIPSKY